MGTERECLCCAEVERVVEKRDSAGMYKCITEVEGFRAVCLVVDVLQTAYWHYRCVYGEEEMRKTAEEKYRYSAYRQFVTWVYQHLGKDIRVVLPACVIRKIREEFPSEMYTGFRLPPL